MIIMQNNNEKSTFDATFNPGKAPEVFNLHMENDGNDHYFCAEELFQSFANHTDTQRSQMFSNHINQTVHLVEPEFPKVFSGFENQIGKYSIAYKKAKSDATIIAKIPKNALNTTYIIQYKDGTFDCIDYHGAINISEEYGYGVQDCLANKNAGDKISEGDYFYKSSNYDDQGNFGYGTNLKAVYIPWHNLTYEDKKFTCPRKTYLIAGKPL